MADPVYRPRKPKASPLWQCLFRHFDAFLGEYEECFRKRYGFLRPIVPDVVNKFLDCGDLEHGFARIRCDHCKIDHFLAFSCKGRWFCPSCHQKKVQLFGALLAESVLYPVPHRHYTLGIPKMLRPYFRYNRDLLKEVRDERYREDLYYRLNVFPIRIPPLRERQEDIPILAEYFVPRFAAHLDQTAPVLNAAALQVLLGYDWPGNVRELEHTLQRAALLAADGTIRPDHLGLGPVATVASQGVESAIVPLAEHERQYLERVLQYTGGSSTGSRALPSCWT